MNRGTKSEDHGSSHGMYNPRPRANQSSDDAASAEHRRKLEAMFSGGSQSQAAAPARTPSAQTAPRVFASPRRSLGRSPSEYRLRLERLRIARELDEIKEAADVFLNHHQLPDDMEILLKVLQHPSERVLRDAMGQISSLIIQGRAGSTIILTDRLSDIGGRALEPATQSYIEGLKSQLAMLAPN